MRIFLIRHGESEANADKECYKKTSDHNLKLTIRGIKQAEDASLFLKDYLSKLPEKEEAFNNVIGSLIEKLELVSGTKMPDQRLKFKLYKSPYLRARHT